MTVKEDLRVKKTKKALNQAFTKLITEVPYENISVNELCLRAGVRRATFYKHYKDKQDFFMEYVGYLRFSYDSKPDTVSHIDAAVDYYVNYAKWMVGYVNSNSTIIDNLLASNQLPIVVELVTSKNYSDTYQRLKASVSAGLELPASVEVVSYMLIGGVATAIFGWITSGRKTNVDILTNEIAVLVKKVLTA